MATLSFMQLSKIRTDLARSSLIIGKRHGVSFQIGEIDNRKPAPPCTGSEIFKELSTVCSLLSQKWGVALHVADIVTTSTKVFGGHLRLRRIHFSIG